MSGFSTGTNEHLIRTQIWSTRIKEIFEDELMGMNYVDMITDFPDGNVINIPSIGQAEVRDYGEDQAAVYTSLDTGNFTLNVNQYKASGISITEKMKQDSFYASQLASKFVPSMTRAMTKSMEIDMLNQPFLGQTNADPNNINGADHRLVGGGTNNVITVEDFAKARYALQKAQVPMTNLVAIVDPSVEFEFNTQTNVVNFLAQNPQWSPVVNDGISTGMRFRFNIYGFDVYVSDNLRKGSDMSDGTTTVTNGVCNLFFSADSMATPIIGVVRQPPKLDTEYNMDFQSERYLLTARWGLKLYRPENMVTVVTAHDQVA